MAELLKIKVNGKGIYLRYFCLENERDRAKYIGNTFKTNSYGDVKVIGVCYKGKKMKKYLIRFLDTGHFYKARSDQLKEGSIMDCKAPSVYGVGYVSEKNTTKDKKMYSVWSQMLSRCYNPKDKRYESYGGKGITVSKRWHDFSKFLKDVKKYKNYKKALKYRNYTLDKDKKQLGRPTHHKVYSKDNCCFISNKENMLYRFIEENDIFKAKKGKKIYYHYNQNKFASIVGIGQSHISCCLNGKRNTTYGYEFEKLETFPSGWDHFNCTEKCKEIFKN
jgi:hypothetical protein